MRHTGIDEAGYGPTLGPLAIVRVSVVAAAGVDPGTALAATGVRDSKDLHVSGNLAPLERVALPGLAWLAGFVPDTAADVFALLGESAVARAETPWMAGAGALRLPVAATPCPPWHPDGLLPAGVAGALVQPAAYNAWLRHGGNKADLELDRVGSLLAAVHQPNLDQDTVVDRLGGRKFYRDALQEHLGALALVEEESAQASVYRLDRHRIAFRVGGESASACTALASCVAKYARELHMLLLNRWWGERLRWLKPTAGYPEDAKRWLHQIGEGHVNAHGDALVRGWRGPTLPDNH
jgi:ribonuclease HII